MTRACTVLGLWGAALWALLLIACAPPPTPPPTAIPTPERPRFVLRQASAPEDLLGVWADDWTWPFMVAYTVTRPVGYWYEFAADGAYRVVYQTQPDHEGRVQALRELEAAPRFEGRYWFEGKKLHLRIAKSAIEPPLDCLETEAVYEVVIAELFGQVSMKLYEVGEPCEARAKEFAVVYVRYR